MTEVQPPTVPTVFKVADIVLARVKEELPELVRQDPMLQREILKLVHSFHGSETADAFDRGRLFGQGENAPDRERLEALEQICADRLTVIGAKNQRIDDLEERIERQKGTIRTQIDEIADLRASYQTANEAFLNVATERDGIRGDLFKARAELELSDRAARSHFRRLELVRAYLHPGCRGGGPQQVRDALDENVDPWSILLPNEPF